MSTEPLYDPALQAHVAEVRAFNAKLPREDARMKWTPAAIARARDLAQVMGGMLADAGIPGFETREIPGPRGPIRLRTFVPDDVRAVYYDVHGGGFFMGAPEMDDRDNAAIARRARCAIVSVDYRLAPEHPYPAGPDDCEAAALWLLAHAQRELGASRLAIGGGSAGANLAATTLVRLRDRHQSASRFCAANLVFGVYDLSGTPSQRSAGLPSYRDLYLPKIRGDDRKHPDISPLYADLSGLPPALFTVGTADSLYDDSLFLHARWRAAGNESELAIYPECVHGFTMFPIAMARAANARIHEWLAKKVG
ncbi:MAG TPA: alpha/beta hydrolase fold domain-containing protein [Myxococcota bacterium]|nr:alpha/beta hydrolase fold domain-containing protein [Myxococcota bacterium]